MVTFRVQYKDGQFTPLDDVSTLPDGITLELTRPPLLSTPDEIQDMLNRSAGAWSSELADEIEQHIAEARQMWDEEWQQKLNSL